MELSFCETRGKYGCVAFSFLLSRDHIRVLPLTVSRVPVVVPFPLFFCSRCRFGSPVDGVHELQGWLAQTANGDMGLAVDPLDRMYTGDTGELT